MFLIFGGTGIIFIMFCAIGLFAMSRITRSMVIVIPIDLKTNKVSQQKYIAKKSMLKILWESNEFELLRAIFAVIGVVLTIDKIAGLF